MKRSILRSGTAALALAVAGPAAAQEDLEAACDIPTLSAGNPDAALLQRCQDAGFLTAGDVELLQAQDLPDEAEPDGAADHGGAAVDEPVETEVEDAEAGGEGEAEGEAGGEIVVDQAPRAEVEEGVATEEPGEDEDAPAAAEGGGDAAIVIEEDAEGVEGTLDVDPAAGGGEDDAAVAVDQAPQAEVEPGAATAEPDAAEEAPEAGGEAQDGTEEAATPADEGDAAEQDGAAAEEGAPEAEPVDEAGREAQDGTEEVETPADEGDAAEQDGAAAEEEAPETEPVDEAGGEAQDGTEEVETPAQDQSDAAEEDGAAVEEAPAAGQDGQAAADGSIEPSEVTTGSLEEALDEAVDQDLGAEAAAAAEDTMDVGLGEQTEPTTPEERAGGELEAAQEDSEASAARANEAPVAAAAAEDAAMPEGKAVTLTEEATRSAEEEFAVEEDEEGLSGFERALLVGLGAVAVGSLLDDGGEVVENTGDRVVVERDGRLQVLKNDDELLRRPGSTVSQRRFDDGSTLNVVEREDGTRVTTIRAPNGQVLRRTRTLPDGSEVVLFDDTAAVEPVDVAQIREFRERSFRDREVEDLAAALGGDPTGTDRAFSLQQIREIRAVRELMPQIDVVAIEFDTGSAVIRPSEAEALRDLGSAMAELIEANPGEVFLVEGHTDAVGSAASNLALSDRRAESVALALAEYFDVPPESMVAQGYGEANLKVPTAEALRENRRASVRRITPLLQGAAAQ